MSDLDKINSIFNAKIDSVKTKEDLQNIKTEFLEKMGKLLNNLKILARWNLIKERTLLQA